MNFYRRVLSPNDIVRHNAECHYLNISFQWSYKYCFFYFGNGWESLKGASSTKASTEGKKLIFTKQDSSNEGRIVTKVVNRPATTRQLQLFKQRFRMKLLNSKVAVVWLKQAIFETKRKKKSHRKNFL